MRSKAYFVSLAMAALVITLQFVQLVVQLLGVPLPPIASVLALFASPIPAPLLFLLGPLAYVVVLVFSWLVYRRLWLLYRGKERGAPTSLTVWPGRLLVVAVASMLLMLAGLALTAVLGAGSGVPAAMLGIPASFLLGPVLFYVELRSLRTVRHEGT